MEEIRNFELVDNGRDRKIKEREGAKVDLSEKSILDMEPSKWETIWNVSLILTAYIGMGVLLGVRLIWEIIKYLMTLCQ